MSSITFDILGNTEPYEKSLKGAVKTTGEFVKEVEKAGEKADQGLNKVAKSFKEVIRDQKELIKSIEKDIKSLQKAYDDATAGRAKQAAGFELRSAKRALAEEQGTLLGIQKQQIEANTKEAKSQEGIIGKLKGWGIGLVSVGAAMKIAKGIIDSTADTQLKFEIITAQATAGVGYFFRAIASGDWSNFLKGLDNAVKGAREFVEAMSDIENKRNELNIKSAEFDVKIGEARAKTYDTDIQVQKEALTEIISLQEQRFTKIKEFSEKEYKTNLEKAASASQLSEAQIENFLKEYSSLDKLIELGEKYNELKKIFDPFAGLSDENIRIQSLIDSMGKAGEEAGKYVTQISNVTPETRKILSDFLVKTINDTAAFNLNNRRDKQRLMTLEKQEIKDKIEAAKIENKIKEEQELLNKAIAENNDAEIRAIGKRIVELEKELEVRERIAKQVIEAMQFEGFVPTLVETEGIKTPSVLPKIKKKTVQKQWEEIHQKMTSLSSSSKKWQEEMADAIAKNDQRQIAALKEKLENQKQLIAGASELVYLAGKQLGLDEEQLKVLDDKLLVIGQFASGNYIGAAITAVISVVSSFMSLIPDQSAKLDKQIEHINQLLVEQQRLIDLSARKGGQEGEREKGLTLLKEQLAIQEKALQKAQDYLDPNKFKLFRTGAGMERAAKDVEYLTLAIQESQNAIYDADQALTDFLTGGITENIIADSIAQGFREGKTSVDDFGQYMNDILLDAVMNIFKGQLLSSPQMKVFTDDLKLFMADQVLTEEEVEKLKKDQLAIVSASKLGFEALTQGLDLTGGAAATAGLTGIVRNITEETGNELTGLFRRFADEQRVVKDYSILGVNHLMNIEKNTYDTVMRLDSAVIELQAINSNTKQVPAGSL